MPPESGCRERGEAGIAQAPRQSQPQQEAALSSSSLNAAGGDPSESASRFLERLRTEHDIDLAKVGLTFEGFRALAQNPHLSANERIGFPETYRDGFEEAILRDIAAKLPALLGTGATIVDIGPRCAGPPHRLIDLCRERNHRLALVDSAEMLAQLSDVAGVTMKIAGAFPANRDTVRDAIGQADIVLCYSVFHYVFAFGISAEEGGRTVNPRLLTQKEFDNSYSTVLHRFGQWLTSFFLVFYLPMNICGKHTVSNTNRYPAASILHSLAKASNSRIGATTGA
ncbi:hypothetical protein MMSR116_04540 [Methylobacterium mesophilicum SR1.6/6]|uniref:Pterin-binding domain-containing protein n=1 Tax=Methylobacterium mesophilicum SR1.6/6 TaxID=908290 RepID=A0A6B9FD93_9HYPH|nr:hypothetical protein [Methylobacterium mesophilicum]QGY01251.1 hypothetical protein MMSR116_04540 [Methylobacterium mesophilicum SR1.6/6]